MNKVDDISDVACTFINSIVGVGSFDYEWLAVQFPRLEIVSSSIRVESRDYKETTTTTTIDDNAKEEEERKEKKRRRG